MLYKLKGYSNIIIYDDYTIKKQDNISYIFIKMEYSLSLTEYLKTNKLSLEDIVKLGIDISNALISCHKNDIIHRDIKEANIFVSDKDKSFKLGDFSVSKMSNYNQSMRTKVGTLSYIPPEIINNKNITIILIYTALG